MGIFDIFFEPQSPTIPSIMPKIAINELRTNRLPIIQSSNLLLNKNETCHFAERAILLHKKVQKNYQRMNHGFRINGLLLNNQHLGHGRTKVVEREVEEQIKGILYITNQRVVFSAQKQGINQKIKQLTVMNPQQNGLELQFGTKMHTFLLPDGQLAQRVIRLVIDKENSNGI